MVPNGKPYVDGVYFGGGHDLTTKEGCGRFTEACAAALHHVDAGFGHLRKRPGQNQWNGHAVDAVLYRQTGQSVDIIRESETDRARPAWEVDIPRYANGDWYAPEGSKPQEPGGGGGQKPTDDASEFAAIIDEATEKICGTLKALLSEVKWLNERIAYLDEHGVRFRLR